jgi:hypothetical protein
MTRPSAMLPRAKDMLFCCLFAEPFIASAEPGFFCWTIFKWQLDGFDGLLAYMPSNSAPLSRVIWTRLPCQQR